jgi:hypothetical protein
MRTPIALATGIAALALTAAPALATKPEHPGANGKAYGKYCKAESKKHVAGQKGTPFSNCVTAMAKVAKGANPTTACKTESKKHVAGQHGTPYSNCVSGAAKLKHDEADSTGTADTTTTTNDNPTGSDTTPTGDATTTS